MISIKQHNRARSLSRGAPLFRRTEKKSCAWVTQLFATRLQISLKSRDDSLAPSNSPNYNLATNHMSSLYGHYLQPLHPTNHQLVRQSILRFKGQQNSSSRETATITVNIIVFYNFIFNIFYCFIIVPVLPFARTWSRDSF